jgi:hypothetical protein
MNPSFKSTIDARSGSVNVAAMNFGWQTVSSAWRVDYYFYFSPAYLRIGLS